MAFFDSTIYGSVTMSVLKQTDSWKNASDASGKIPSQHLFTQVVEQALYELGYDNSFDPILRKKKRYKKEKFQNIRSLSDNTVVFNTTVFRFPVRKDFRYKDIYNKHEILHFGEENFTGWKKSHHKMEDFGNAYQPIYTKNEDTEDSEV